MRGADALKEGLPRRRASAQSRPPKLVTADSQADDIAAVSKNGSCDPATVRPRLAEAAAEGVEGIRKTLLDAATGAVRDHWITFECGECGARKRVEVPVPDVRARVAAIELLLREGLGRPATAEEIPSPRMPATVAALDAMSWDEMQALFAATYADEIAAIQRDGGKALVRQKLAALSQGERRVLREALETVGKRSRGVRLGKPMGRRIRQWKKPCIDQGLRDV
jgi:hypothetical protein